MALEIQEIGIQLQVAEDGGDAGESSERRQGESRRRPASGLGCCEEEERQAIVDDCVERVLRALERQRQR